MKSAIISLITCALLAVGIRIYMSVQFDIHCGSYMVRAANANTVELARDQMAVVIKYLEDNHITNGTTAVVRNDPTMDVGYFYNNMKGAYLWLCNIQSDASDLTRSNVLLKLKETLIKDSGDARGNVDVPRNISIYPYNAIWVFLFTLLAVAAIILICWVFNYYGVFEILAY